MRFLCLPEIYTSESGVATQGIDDLDGFKLKLVASNGQRSKGL